DKFQLFHSLCAAVGLGSMAILSGAPQGTDKRPATPGVFSHLFISTGYLENAGAVRTYSLDPALEVAPFGMLPAAARGLPVLGINPPLSPKAGDVFYVSWMPPPTNKALAAMQSVKIEARLTEDGTLKTSVRYSLRGDNELLLRVTFHRTATEKQ